ncbi:MAG: tripartite tricarboxylate transporter substrate binding protein [Proteobacteria bacterium]|nr:tripartite tricarboxylate transporter substrate binding protein [Pseudomonadota bacterium]
MSPSDTQFPQKPIRIILPFDSGGSSDTVAILLKPKMEEALGQKIELEYITGGRGGSKGPEAVADAEPDGYTMLMATIGNIALLPAIYREYGIVPTRDLLPVCKIADTADALVANNNLPVTNIAELIEYAKAHPGLIKCHAVNAASIHRLEFSALMKETGISLTEVPPEGGSDGAIEAVQSGEADLMFTTAPRLIPHIKSGAVRALAAVSPRRAAALPNLPTMLEQGVSSLPIGSWMGFFVPAGTPNEIISILHYAGKTAAEDPGVSMTIEGSGMDVATSDSPAEFKAFVDSETARLAAAVEVAGLSL